MREDAEKLLTMLPAIYHESHDLASLLAIFESILYGIETNLPEEGIPQSSTIETLPIVDRISAIPSLFDAYETPREFIPWLAQWVALKDMEDLSENSKRQLMADIVPLYPQRGTAAYLKKILTYFIPEITKVEVEDQHMGIFIVGKALIGSTSRFDQDRPFWFRVDISVSIPDYSIASEESKSKLETRVRRVIDLAKPAHTLYELNIQNDKT
jgi:phage tail-like protein